MLVIRRSARRSAAELLGAQASMRALESVNNICRIDSTTVTVFPVPGLKYEEIKNEKIRCGERKSYGPKMIKGTLPGGIKRIVPTARN